MGRVSCRVLIGSIRSQISHELPEFTIELGGVKRIYISISHYLPRRISHAPNSSRLLG
jgi:hypothetical protein